MNLQETLNQLEETLDLYFGQKAPQMPANIKETLVNVLPWLLLILLVLTVPGLLTAFSIGAILSPFTYFYGVSTGVAFFASWLLLAAMIVLEVKALPGLFKRKKSSWKLLFYAGLLAAIQSLVSLNVMGFILGTVIQMYVLFQTKPLYR